MKKNNTQNKKWDLGWGNPYFLLDILSNLYKDNLSLDEVKTMSYAPDGGFQELVDLTKEVIRVSSGGLVYDHVIITAGATQALNSILKFEKMLGSTSVFTTEYGYPFYGNMISNLGMERVVGEGKPDFYVIDSPTNPEGRQIANVAFSGPCYWDSVYHSKIYSANLGIYPKHEVMVGSYSKLLGLTGARVGWMATNSENLAKELSRISLYDTATVSVPSQRLVTKILKSIDLINFMTLGKASLDSNRTEIQKLTKFFDGQDVQPKGMFYLVREPEQKALDLLDKSDVHYMVLEDGSLRLSLGQTREVTSNAVKQILKNDRT